MAGLLASSKMAFVLACPEASPGLPWLLRKRDRGMPGAYRKEPEMSQCVRRKSQVRCQRTEDIVDGTKEGHTTVPFAPFRGSILAPGAWVPRRMLREPSVEGLQLFPYWVNGAVDRTLTRGISTPCSLSQVQGDSCL